MAGLVPAIQCARRSWRYPAGVSPAQVRGSARLVASVASASGDGAGEAYTAIAWGVLLSPEIGYVARAELVGCSEGNMCGVAMRDPVASPGSKTTSRAKGDRRNLGDLASGRSAQAGPVRPGKARSRSRG
jgi:hypothetical protein